MLKKLFGMVIDLERCIGCEACTVACKTENSSSGYWIRVETRHVSQKGTPEGRFPDLKMTFLPQLCNHCTTPPCIDVCPQEALVKREDGPVILDEARCDGCEACREVCPYDALHYGRNKEKVGKCSFCVHRIDQGLEPFCVTCCEGQAIHFGDLNDPGSPASRFIAARETFQLIPEAGTGPSVYYCPPRDPRRL